MNMRFWCTVMSAAALLAACGDDDESGATTTITALTTTTVATTTAPVTTAPATTAPATTAPATSVPNPNPARNYDFNSPQVVGTGLSVPWGLAFLPDGSALVSERTNGRILQIAPGKDPVEVMKLPSRAIGEGGALGLAVSPNYPSDKSVFAYYTTATGNVVARFTLGGEPDVILSGIAAASTHNGGRLAFGRDGFLYVTTGDAGTPANAQNRTSLNGKILRITADGRPAPGNPFNGSPVWSYGHRNVQGLAWDAKGRLFASEFGQNRLDEVNLIEAGKNYGWPNVEGTGTDPQYVNPLITWPTSQSSPSGAAISGGFLYVGALQGKRLWQIPITDSGLGEPGRLFDNQFGRIRSVAVAPDGALWFTTSNRDGRGSPVGSDDRVVRVLPGT
ncbi:MAG: sorbosone dehydrogenase family protein [Acidimicrobiia bacterium]